ncbi:MAG TPA: bifunctional aspartate kinase/homoserine dehydrogenase I [Pyrinomonadaceae bacterium]|nr:bifunctional aspartate kinase/homoserine dehydrogenase I [Pyrinomonadaceae bacterium]
MDKWAVHKFGGTSVADAGRYGAVAEIVLARRAEGRRAAVVVSAMSGVTDALIELVELAAGRDASYEERLSSLRARHLETAAQIGLDGPRGAALAAAFESDFAEITEVLRGVWIARLRSESITEFISGYGEIWSAQLLHARLAQAGHAAAWLDAREVLIVEPDARAVAVDWESSRERLSRWLARAGGAETVVVTGYVASTRAGVATTLKRNGSDYSASIFAALLGAESVTIWTDVDGVLSADPRRVPDALVVPRLSYQEAAELAYFGAKVIHPNTMSPVIAGRIPVHIRNSLDPAAAGTTISAEAAPEMPVKGFASVEGMTLVNVEGTGMVGVPGVANKLFGALRAMDVSVVLISQGSSEHSICFAVPSAQAGLARTTVEEAFTAEMRRGQIQTVGLTPGCCILAVVGDGMVDVPGVAGKFFTALGRAGVSVRAIAQGASERNISAVIAEHDATKALRAVHSAFYLSRQTLSVGVVGAGLIGGTFLNQLRARLGPLRSRRSIDVRVRAVMNSRRMLLHDRQVELGSWEEDLRGGGAEEADLERFAEHVLAEHLPHACIIDATSSAEVAARYESWLERGINVITPNKKGNTGTLSQYRAVREAARRRGRYFLYETNVGAGLPVIHTLRDLLDTGDEVVRVEGVLSGTLSYIFNTFDGTRPFSEVVREAHARGYTEPDPRDDLSGVDVARKLVILAREMGLGLEMGDVKVESLVPEDLRAAGVEEYLGSLSKHDAAMAGVLEAARSRRQALRYVGTIEPGGVVSAGLRAFPLEHPFANLSGSDNVVSFRTARYDVQPMIVRGPGAGPDVTAAGVFADLLRLASFLGAPL